VPAVGAGAASLGVGSTSGANVWRACQCSAGTRVGPGTGRAQPCAPALGGCWGAAAVPRAREGSALSSPFAAVPAAGSLPAPGPSPDQPAGPEALTNIFPFGKADYHGSPVITPGWCCCQPGDPPPAPPVCRGSWAAGWDGAMLGLGLSLGWVGDPREPPGLGSPPPGQCVPIPGLHPRLPGVWGGKREAKLLGMVRAVGSLWHRHGGEVAVTGPWHESPRFPVPSPRWGCCQRLACLRAGEDQLALPALSRLLPRQALMLADGDSAGFLYRQLPFLASLERKDGKATAYVCSNFACSLPVTSPQELRGMLCP